MLRTHRQLQLFGSARRESGKGFRHAACVQELLRLRPTVDELAPWILGIDLIELSQGAFEATRPSVDIGARVCKHDNGSLLHAPHPPLSV